jgi:transposase
MNDASLKGRVPHGERHWGAKLTEDKARELIAVRDRDGLSYRNLAKLFGISTMQACRICTGKRWAGLSRKEDE